MGSSISYNENYISKQEEKTDFLNINVEFGGWLMSGVIGVIYVWNDEDKYKIRNLVVNSNSSALEIVKKAANELNLLAKLPQDLQFCLVITQLGCCCDRTGEFRPLNTKLEDITLVANEKSSQSIWELGARENCTIQIELKEFKNIIK